MDQRGDRRQDDAVMLLLETLRLNGDEAIYLYSSGSTITACPRLALGF